MNNEVIVDVSKPPNLAQSTTRLWRRGRGAFEAIGSQITVTLPSGLTFLSASQPVILDGSKLVWETGNLSDGSIGKPILVTALVNEQAVPGSDLIVTVEIESESTELETADNSTQANIYIGKIVYLPLVERQVSQAEKSNRLFVYFRLQINLPHIVEADQDDLGSWALQPLAARQPVMRVIVKQVVEFISPGRNQLVF